MKKFVKFTYAEWDDDNKFYDEYINIDEIALIRRTSGGTHIVLTNGTYRNIANPFEEISSLLKIVTL